MEHFRIFKSVLSFILFLCSFSVSSQDCDLLLMGDSAFYKGNTLNKIIDGKKEGQHLNFILHEMYDIIHSDYNDWSYSTTKIYYDIQPIYDSISDKFLTIPEIIEEKNKKRKITNCVQEDYLQLLSKGGYRNNEKEGIWYFYYENGSISTKINFKEGMPIDTIFFYYKNGEIEAKITPISSWKFIDMRFSMEGQITKIDTTTKKDYCLIFD